MKLSVGSKILALFLCHIILIITSYFVFLQRIIFTGMDLKQLIKSEQYDRAIEECKAIIADADLEDDKEGKLTGLIYLGIVYTKQKAYFRSKAIFDLHFDTILANATLYWDGKELIETYQFYSDFSKAHTYVVTFLKHNPKHIDNIVVRSFLLYQQKYFNQALESFIEAEKLNPNNARIHYGIGLIYKQKEQLNDAFYCFEKAFDLGYEKAIYELLKLLFVRQGYCDFENCTDCCCKGVLLKGIDGKTISSDLGLTLLLEKDSRNKCWQHQSINNKGNWVFSCKNLGEQNICNDYNMRPDTCRDYPTSIITSRKACSYHFKLNNKLLLFKSKNCLRVIIHILKAYAYLNEVQVLLKQNQKLIID